MGSKLLRAGDADHGFAGIVNRRFESIRGIYTRLLTGTLHYRPVVLTLWVIVAALMVPFYMFSQHELAPAEDQGVVFGVIQSSANSTLDQTNLFTNQVYDVYHSFPESDSIFQITNPERRFRRHGHQAMEPAQKDRATTAGRILGQAIEDCRHSRDSSDAAAAAGRRQLPVDFVIASAAEPEQVSQLAEQIVQKAMASGMFIYADTDVKFDQPQTEVVFDRDKLRSQGVDLSQAGQDLSTMLGGNYVNRFSIQGRSYKVIPQVQARGTPDSGSAFADLCERFGRQAGAALDLCHSEDHDRAAIAE